ncbi:MAG: MoaD/ThiS family protein [Deltaproteobacteria bacterium]|nr:MoaD/ThiS family protein [Deltaproteobacteria bacterium]
MHTQSKTTRAKAKSKLAVSGEVRLIHTLGEASPEETRAALVAQGRCHPGHPAVTLELYGNLRLKAGCASLPIRADSVSTALDLLLTLIPSLSAQLPTGPALFEHYRVSINGRNLVRELDHALEEGDHLVLFSATVGG